MALVVAGVTERDQVAVGIAPGRQFVPGGLVAVILPVMHLEAGGGPAIPAAVGIPRQDMRPFCLPLRVLEHFAIRGVMGLVGGHRWFQLQVSGFVVQSFCTGWFRWSIAIWVLRCKGRKVVCSLSALVCGFPFLACCMPMLLLG